VRRSDTLNKVGRIVNGNGEVICEIFEGDRIVRAQSVELLKQTIEWKKEKPFVKVFIDYLPKLANELSGGAVTTAIRLAKYVNYGSGLLSKSNGGKPLTHKDIEDIMGYTERQVIRIMSELVEHKIMFKGRTGRTNQYYANPHIMVKGVQINKTLEAMFADYE
jgi:hypothetical protein